MNIKGPEVFVGLHFYAYTVLPVSVRVSKVTGNLIITWLPREILGFHNYRLTYIYYFGTGLSVPCTVPLHCK